MQWLEYLLLDSAAPGPIPSIPQKISEEKIADIALVINGTVQMKVDRTLRMIIQPILYEQGSTITSK